MGKYFTSFDKTQIYYEHVKGKKDTTLVFLHGVGCNLSIWKKEIDCFQNLGFSTLAFDFRGHGRSDIPGEFNKYQMEYFVNDLHLLLAKKKITNFIFLGFSLGGAIATFYCMLKKDNLPKSIVFIDAATVYPFPSNRLLNMNPYIVHLLRFIANHKPTRNQNKYLGKFDFSRKNVKADVDLILYLLHITPLQTIVNTLDNTEKFFFKNRSLIDKTFKNLNIPALVISAQYDEVIPTRFSKRIVRLDKRAEFKLIKNAHHKVIIERPEDVNVCIYEFFKDKHFV